METHKHSLITNNTYIKCCFFLCNFKKGAFFPMPKTFKQNLLFTAMMSFLMVYVMILFNISLNIGGMTNQVFLLAFHEMIIMWPVAFFLELLVVDSLAHKLAFRFVQPTDRPIVITLAISCMIVCIMCPCMSLIATVLFKNIDASVYFQTSFINFPVALLFQIFYCGPLIRFLFEKIVHE